MFPRLVLVLVLVLGVERGAGLGDVSVSDLSRGGLRLRLREGEEARREAREWVEGAVCEEG